MKDSYIKIRMVKYLKRDKIYLWAVDVSSETIW